MKRTPRTKRKYGPALYLSLPSYKKKLAKQVRDQHRKGLSPEKRKRVRKVSKTRAKQLRVYSKRVKVWKKDKLCFVRGMVSLAGPICFDQPHRCDDPHHSRGRSGPLLLDERFWVPVCRRAHDWIKDHPAEAKALGLIEGPWNTMPKEKAA